MFSFNLTPFGRRCIALICFFGSFAFQSDFNTSNKAAVISKPIPEWRVATEPVREPISGGPVSEAATSEDLGTVSRQQKLDELWAAITDYNRRMCETVHQTSYLINWSNVTNWEDERVSLLMQRVHSLNNERATVYAILDLALADETITPANYEDIATNYIVISWRVLSANLTGLDKSLGGGRFQGETPNFGFGLDE